ncbi:MAG: Ig-like domain-containing protein [Pseudomonadota bacterium]
MMLTSHALPLISCTLLFASSAYADVLTRIGTQRDWADLTAWYNVTTGNSAAELPTAQDLTLVSRDRILTIESVDAAAGAMVINNDLGVLGTTSVVQVLAGATLEAGEISIGPRGGGGSLLIDGGDVRSPNPVRIASPNGRLVLSQGRFTNSGRGARDLFSFANSGTVTLSGGTFAASGESPEDALTFYGPDIVVTGGELLITDGQALVHENTRLSVSGAEATIRLDRLNAAYAFVAGTFRFVLDSAGEVSPIIGKDWVLLDSATVIVDAGRYAGGGDVSVPLFEVTDSTLISLPSTGISVINLPEGVSEQVTIEPTGTGSQIVLRLRQGDSQAPVAFDRLVSIGVGQERQIYLPARDADGDSLTYQYSQPELGAVSGDGPLITYTPNSEAGTTDSFSFSASDGTGPSNEATITLEIEERALTLNGLPADSAYIPETFEELWADYDPTVDALEAEVFQSTITDDGIIVQKVIFTIGTFETIAYGVERARLAAYYAYPQDAGPDNPLPAVVHIHGGGGRSDLDEVLYAARNGYVGLSLNWDARDMNPLESADVDVPGMEFDPNHPNTDWGALRDMAGNLNYTYFTYFGLDLVTDGTLDQVVQSPRNSLWFLTAIANRRALTFLQAQPEVDPTRLAVRGFSLGGVQTTVLAGVDDRLTAANPSVGGAGEISQERKDDIGLPGFNVTVVPPAHALVTPITAITQIDIPILYTGPTNDFAAPMDNLMYNWNNIMPVDTPLRFAIPPRGNHENPVSTDVNSMLWFDQHLKGEYLTPSTPTLSMDYSTGRARAHLTADTVTGQVNRVDIYYSVGTTPYTATGAPANG